MSDDDNVPPFDIQIEIMKRLPIESLLKFRSVSKPWKSIIHSSGFIADYNNHRTHRCNNQKLLIGSCFENNIDIFDDDNSFPKHKSSVTLPKLAASSSHCYTYILGYSQGLFGFYNDDSHVVVIWNPSIRKSVDVTIPPENPSSVIGFGVRNATDPIIVTINNAFDRSSLHVEVFRLSSRVWRSFSNTECLPLMSLVLTRIVVTIDNFIYWLAIDGGRHNRRLILSFDMIREEFKQIDLPPILAQTRDTNLELYKIRESLVVLQTIDYWEEDDKYEHDVWMSEDGVQNSFKKLYTVKPPNASRQWVCGFRHNGQPIIQRVGYGKRRFIVYDPDSKCFNDIGDISEIHSLFAGSYMGTLLLLDH